MSESPSIVVIESPFGSRSPLVRKANRLYANHLMRAAFARGKVPIASHVFYTEALDDSVLDERLLGMAGGFLLGELGEECWIGVDLGVSSGMTEGILRAQERGQKLVEISTGLSYGDLLSKVLFPRTLLTVLLSGSVALLMGFFQHWSAAIGAVAVGAVADMLLRVHVHLTARGEMNRRGQLYEVGQEE